MKWLTFLHRYSVLMCSTLLISLVVLIIMKSGIGLSFDSNSYAEYAADMIKHKFNMAAFINDHYPRLLTYSVPIYLMSVIKLIFGEGWKWAYIWFNVICVALMAWRFNASLRKLDINPIAISAGILLAILSIDHLIWPHFVLTDTMYSMMVLFIFTIPIFLKLNTIRNLVIFAFCLFLLMVTRPTALPVVLAVIAFAIVIQSQIKLFRPCVLLPLLCLAVIGFSYLWALFFNAYALGEVTKSKNIDYIFQFVASGAIVTERDGSNIEMTGQLFDYMKLYLLRVMYFFSPYSKEFSTVHNLTNFIWLGSFFLSVLCTPVMFKKGLITKEQVNMITGVVILAVAVACYHSAILLDYDWRYRYPVILPMLMAVAIVLSGLFNRFFKETVDEKS